MRNLPIVLGFVAVLGMIVAAPIIHFNTMDTVTTTITDKYRNHSGDSSRFMVDTEDASGRIEVFENTDSLLAFKWNSADIQAKLRPGQTCTLDVNGFRFGMLSMNRNILSAECS